MAGRSQEKEAREFQHDRERGADYFRGFSKAGFEGREESHAPYKLEPNATEIEDFLTRLRQEGL
ncbi:MAG: hypothetical protein OEM27_02320 [Nitrospinota bacterium]|nr:hypothetical protein [Nitrospinota bacterium]